MPWLAYAAALAAFALALLPRLGSIAVLACLGLALGLLLAGTLAWLRQREARRVSARLVDEAELQRLRAQLEALGPEPRGLPLRQASEQ
ncbi:MAG: hypothetical protein ACK4JC_06700 [Silanimonas lenta]